MDACGYGMSEIGSTSDVWAAVAVFRVDYHPRPKCDMQFSPVAPSSREHGGDVESEWEWKVVRKESNQNVVHIWDKGSGVLSSNTRM